MKIHTKKRTIDGSDFLRMSYDERAEVITELCLEPSDETVRDWQRQLRELEDKYGMTTEQMLACEFVDEFERFWWRRLAGMVSRQKETGG